MNSTVSTPTSERPMVAVQPASYWLPTYRARYYNLSVNLGIELKGFVEVIAALEVLAQVAPESPVALMCFTMLGETLCVFYDIANERELGHYRLPELHKVGLEGN